LIRLIAPLYDQWLRKRYLILAGMPTGGAEGGEKQRRQTAASQSRKDLPEFHSCL